MKLTKIISIKMRLTQKSIFSVITFHDITKDTKLSMLSEVRGVVTLDGAGV